MTTRVRRWMLIIVSLTIILAVAAFAAFQLAVRSLRSEVESALGPHGEVQQIRVALTGVEATGIRIRAPKEGEIPGNWPADDELRADRILVVPSIADLLSARLVISSIRVEGAYLSILRSRDGKIRVLPSLLNAQKNRENETDKASGDSASPAITINHIELVGGTIDFFDATLRKVPVMQRIEQIDASLGRLQLPDLTGQTTIRLKGIHKGKSQDGRLSIAGSIELATKESGLTTELRGVDLVALQPYLIKAADTGVKRGSLDLDLNSSVKKGILHAPGQLTLSNLELSTSGSFMGLSRNAAVAMMKNRKGKISINFVLDGDINDPHFSLNENLLTRVSSSMANVLGISVEGLAKGVEGVGSDVIKGIGQSLGIFKK